MMDEGGLWAKECKSFEKKPDIKNGILHQSLRCDVALLKLWFKPREILLNLEPKEL